jgi:hypothetical protein
LALNLGVSATVGGLCDGAERLIRGTAEVTIQDLGSLGEFVAAIATVATLLYLAIQIRQSNALLLSSTEAWRKTPALGEVSLWTGKGVY